MDLEINALEPRTMKPRCRFGCALTLLLLVLVRPGPPAAAQESHPSNFEPAVVEAEAVQNALRFLESNFDGQVEEWIRITEIPAKSGHEEARARYLMEALQEEGVEVEVDEAGNLVARLPGTGEGPTVVFGAHMDTVHPMDTDVTVRREGGMLQAPGVFDNSASVANMMAVIRALKSTGIRTRGDLIFLGTVEEELGFNGMGAWLEANEGRADMVVALDGGLGAVSYGALWFAERRYTFHGEGAHTLNSRGEPHPARALAEAIESIYEIPLPSGEPFAVFNVGMLGGGKVTNAIPQETWFTVYLRSVSPPLLDELDVELDRRVALAADRHAVEWTRDPPSSPSAVAASRDMLPHAERRSHPLVQTAVDVYEYLGVPVGARDTGSTDAVAAVRRGVPAIAMGRGRGGGTHTLAEWAEAESALEATKAVLLVAVSMGELASR
jgi:acetylornithine deacetylase/succinyl-diaminopimelate desuccinylase-like protein